MKRVLLVVFCFLLSGKYFGQDVPQSERDALVSFYDAMDGDNWNRVDNWKTTQPVSTWYGVTVTNNHVTSIIFDYNRLKGSIPASIKALTFLKTISLTNENIDSLPDEIKFLSALEYMTLENQITSNGQRSIQLPSSLEGLNSLKSLIIDAKILNLPEDIGTLSSLSTVSLNSDLSQLPSSFSNLGSLKELTLNFNNLESLPSGFSNLSNLQYLEINAFYLKKLSQDIGKLLKLQTLKVTTGTLTDLPDSISQLKNLKTLVISGNFVQFPEILSNLVGLQNLLYGGSDDSNNELPSSFSNLVNIENLSISAKGMTCSNPQILSGFTKLTDLYLRISMKDIDLHQNINLRKFFLSNSFQTVNLKNGNNSSFDQTLSNTNVLGNLRCVAVDLPSRAKNKLTPYQNIIIYKWATGYENNFQSDCSSYLAINEIKISDFKIQNPVKDFLIIQGQQKISAIEIFDISGRLVKTFKTAGGDVSSLTRGVYSLKITTEKGVSSQKIIKE